jgi:hypothetical protein
LRERERGRERDVGGKKFTNINEIKKITTSEGNKEQDRGKNYPAVR